MSGSDDEDSPTNETPPPKRRQQKWPHEPQIGAELGRRLLGNSLNTDALVRAVLPKFKSQEVIERIVADLMPESTREAINRAIASQNVELRKAMTRWSDYEARLSVDSPYSDYMSSTERFFEESEVEISSVADLNKKIARLLKKSDGIRLVWRGAREACWGAHSNLYRKLMCENGVLAPGKGAKGPQPYPDEDQLVEAEQVILRTARAEWRFDGLSALETFARIQHAGGPTRLLDVTKNPYVAAWFAVEQDRKSDDEDARLLAFATGPVPRARDNFTSARIELDEAWGGKTPFWHSFEDDKVRQDQDWGTGAQRRIWVPPAYDPRIAAQNAAFMIDGVPMVSEAILSANFRRDDNEVTLQPSDLLAAGSFFLNLEKPTKKPRPNKHNLAPTYTFRIKAEAKREIRTYLEDHFGFTRSYIYPDVAELARHLSSINLTDDS